MLSAWPHAGHQNVQAWLRAWTYAGQIQNESLGLTYFLIAQLWCFHIAGDFCLHYWLCEWYLLIWKLRLWHYSQTLSPALACGGRSGCVRLQPDLHQNSLLCALVNISCLRFIYWISAWRIGETFSTDKTNKLQDNKLEAKILSGMRVCVCVLSQSLTGSISSLLVTTMVVSSK